MLLFFTFFWNFSSFWKLLDSSVFKAHLLTGSNFRVPWETWQPKWTNQHQCFRSKSTSPTSRLTLSRPSNHLNDLFSFLHPNSDTMWRTSGFRRQLSKSVAFILGFIIVIINVILLMIFGPKSPYRSTFQMNTSTALSLDENPAELQTFYFRKRRRMLTFIFP